MTNLTKLKRSNKNCTEQLRSLKIQRDKHYKNYVRCCDYIKALEYSKIQLKLKIKRQREKE